MWSLKSFGISETNYMDFFQNDSKEFKNWTDTSSSDDVPKWSKRSELVSGVISFQSLSLFFIRTFWEIYMKRSKKKIINQRVLP